MTMRFSEWLLALAWRDYALVNFALIAFAAVIMWESFRLWPDRARRCGRGIYLIGGLIAYYALLIAQGTQ